MYIIKSFNVRLNKIYLVALFPCKETFSSCRTRTVIGGLQSYEMLYFKAHLFYADLSIIEFFVASIKDRPIAQQPTARINFFLKPDEVDKVRCRLRILTNSASTLSEISTVLLSQQLLLSFVPTPSLHAAEFGTASLHC